MSLQIKGGSRRVPPMRVHRSNQFENDEVTLLTNKRNLHGYFEYSIPYLVQYIKIQIYSILELLNTYKALKMNKTILSRYS